MNYLPHLASSAAQLFCSFRFCIAITWFNTQFELHWFYLHKIFLSIPLFYWFYLHTNSSNDLSSWCVNYINFFRIHSIFFEFIFSSLFLTTSIHTIPKNPRNFCVSILLIPIFAPYFEFSIYFYSVFNYIVCQIDLEYFIQLVSFEVSFY